MPETFNVATHRFGQHIGAAGGRLVEVVYTGTRGAYIGVAYRLGNRSRPDFVSGPLSKAKAAKAAEVWSVANPVEVQYAQA